MLLRPHPTVVQDLWGAPPPPAPVLAPPLNHVVPRKHKRNRDREGVTIACISDTKFVYLIQNHAHLSLVHTSKFVGDFVFLTDVNE